MEHKPLGCAGSGCCNGDVPSSEEDGLWSWLCPGGASPVLVTSPCCSRVGGGQVRGRLCLRCPLADRLSSQHILVAKRQISVAKSGVEEFRQAFRSYTEVTAGQSSCLQ